MDLKIKLAEEREDFLNFASNVWHLVSIFGKCVNPRSDGYGFHANIIFRENAIIDFQFSGKAFFC
jgi:hypothetical protein